MQVNLEFHCQEKELTIHSIAHNIQKKHEKLNATLIKTKKQINKNTHPNNKHKINKPLIN